jgi:quercetin dioxygenase-like cupin family protein
MQKVGVGVYFPILTFMQILRKEVFAVAIIDPSRKIGEAGQYKRYHGDEPDIVAIIRAAQAAGSEIRRYIENIPSDIGGVIPLKYVITDIPPGHVQPFHRHEAVDEINLVESGEVCFIESETLIETELEALSKVGTVLHAGDVVVTESGKRHTVANLSAEYAHIIGTISAKSATPEFKPDWVR